ncbi:hypothetical protein [Bacillus cereus]|uniref:hypothetical protein n=1 Tax=Bacillus cereus TaxID=1396 RepID=UPI00062DB587|nr:hypothetical protein [Bacillus cereus]
MSDVIKRKKQSRREYIANLFQVSESDGDQLARLHSCLKGIESPRRRELVEQVLELVENGKPLTPRKPREKLEDDTNKEPNR